MINWLKKRLGLIPDITGCGFLPDGGLLIFVRGRMFPFDTVIQQKQKEAEIGDYNNDGRFNSERWISDRIEIKMFGKTHGYFYEHKND